MKSHIYDVSEMAELIGYYFGHNLSEKWIEFTSSSLGNFVEPNEGRFYTNWVNEWLSEHKIPVTVLRMEQESNDEENYNNYKFEIAQDDLQPIQENKNMKTARTMRELIKLMENAFHQGSNPVWDKVRDANNLRWNGNFDEEMQSMRLHDVVDEFLSAAIKVPEFVQKYGNNSDLAYRDANKYCRELMRDHGLLEGVMAVPGLNEKSTSEKQARTMAAAAHNPEFAKKVGIDQSVAKEFNKADTGTEQLSNAMKEGTESDMQTAGTVGRNQDYAEFDQSQGMATESVPAVDSCQQTNPATADVACAMESGVSDLIYDQQYSRFSDLMNSYVEPQEAFDVLSREMAEQGIEGEEHDAIMQRLESDFFPEDSEIGDGMTDAEADADTLKSAGWGSDEDYGGAGDMEFEEAFDLKNGYDDINDASGNDYFPNGADSPVVSKVGPSGARQGDNPEQKKMQVAEVHKELVYGYRNYLKETAVAKKKS